MHPGALSTESVPTPAAPRLQLRTGAILSHVAGWVFLVLLIEVWVKIGRGFPMWSTPRRVLAWLYFSPGMALRAFTIAAAVAVLCDLAFRFVVRPWMVRWYRCDSRDPDYVPGLVFFRKAGERTVAEAGARLVAGRLRMPGRIVLSSEALYFYPYAWDQEPWMLPLGHLAQVGRVMPRRRVLNLVVGYPDHLRVVDDSGSATDFVVADPAAVLDWFRPQPQLVFENA